MSEEIRAALQVDLDMRRGELAGTAGYQDLDEDYEIAMRGIPDHLTVVVGRCATQKGYGLVLDLDATYVMPAEPWAAPRIDITEDIGKLYDRMYPGKRSGAPTLPAAPPQGPAIPDGAAAAPQGQNQGFTQLDR